MKKPQTPEEVVLEHLPEEEAEQKPVMVYELHYSLQSTAGQEMAMGDAEATLDEELLHLAPQQQAALDIAFQEIAGIERQGYKVMLSLVSGEQLQISQLGRQFEEFWGKLSNLHHEQVISDLLMQEALLKTFVEVGYIRVDESGQQCGSGECELRCYETALVVIPTSGAIQRVPFSFISSIIPDGHRVTVALDAGEQFVFRQFGRQFDSFLQTLAAAMQALSQKTEAALKQQFPQAGDATVRKAARLLKDGKAVRKANLDAVAPGFWRRLEALVKESGAEDAYSFLLSLGHVEHSSIGIKRGLMGSLTGEYIWFLIPIFGSPGSPGNALALEAVGETGSRATYFFRIISRQAYAAGEDVAAYLDKALLELNYCLYMINFRREPIYLPETRLDARYRFALRNLPALRSLRERFIGRVIHSNQEQWQRDVQDLLQWNVSTLDDQARWSKSR